MKSYVVDAFTNMVFHGNSAAVCISEKSLSEQLMQAMAAEHNLSETAFASKKDNGYKLRWFTPDGEIDLCGHATLATAYVIMRFIEPKIQSVCFHTKSGVLSVQKNGDLYEMDLPAYQLESVPVTTAISEAIGSPILEAWLGRDLVCVLENEQLVRDARPNTEKIKQLNGLLLHLTAQGSEYDCVTRSFAPKLGVNEDSVCGSGHCHVAPLWAEKLQQQQLCAYQASKRGGVLYCRMNGDRVTIAGHAALYSISDLFLDESYGIECTWSTGLDLSS